MDSTLDDPSQLKNDYQKLTDAVVNAVLEYIGYETETSNYYIVKSGDSLWSIAKKFNTTVYELKNINNLTSNTLSIGQRLLLPGSQTTPSLNTTYKVVSGDTLYSIAKKYNISVNDIKNSNNLSSNNLSVGQTLVIPTTASQPSNEIDKDFVNYIVKSGDSLYSISKSYNVTMQDIIDSNNLSSTLLSIGQILKIPVKRDNESYITYVVKSGDNLYSIAKIYNISVDELMKFNDLKTNLLSIGQVLKIPNTNTYTVVSGDSLYSIAKKFDTTVDTLKQKNNLSNNTLSIGQMLII